MGNTYRAEKLSNLYARKESTKCEVVQGSVKFQSHFYTHTHTHTHRECMNEYTCKNIDKKN